MTKLNQNIKEILSEKEEKIIPSNIRSGIEVLGVEGEFTGDATATADDLFAPKTAYVNGEKITGVTSVALGPGQYVENKYTATSYSSFEAINYQAKVALKKVNSQTIEIWKINNDSSITKTEYSMTADDSAHTMTQARIGYNGTDLYVYISEYYGPFVSTYRWQQFYLYKYKLNTDTLEPTRLFWTQVSGDTSGGYNFSHIIEVCPTNINRLVSAYSGQWGNGAKDIHVILDTTESGFTKSMESNSWSSKVLRYAAWSPNGNFVTIYYSDCTTILNVNTQTVLYSRNTSKPYMLNNDYIALGTDVLNISKEVVGTTNINLSNNNDYKWIQNNYVFRTTGSQCTIYQFDENDFSLTSKKQYSVTSLGISQTSYDSTVFTSNGVYRWGIDENGTPLSINYRNNTLYNPLGATAESAHILSGKIAYGNEGKLTGTMPNNGAVQYTPSASTQNIANGYHNGSTILGDANLVSANIRSGVTIFGVQGNLEPDKPDQTKTVTPTDSQQTVEPDIGYELASVTVEAADMSHEDYVECQELADLILGDTETTDLDYVLINPLVVDQNSDISISGNNLVINTGGTVNE